MAEAANSPHESADFLFWGLGMLHPPEEEIFGRSLSANRWLGEVAIKASLQEAIASPEAAQSKDEFLTSVFEGYATDLELGGGMEVRDIDERQVIDGHVMSKNTKRSIVSMTEAGLKCAHEKYTVERALGDERFLPQLVRTEWDHQVALLVDKMARGETGYNTLLVASPFPEEAAARSGNAYWRNIGYVPHLRRGFIQLHHVTKNGVVLAGSLSFDGSNKQHLTKLFAEHGVQIPEGEVTDNWLKYAITGNFSAEHAVAFAVANADEAGDPQYKKNVNTVDVTKRYGPLIDQVFSQSYIHICESLARGYQTKGASKLIHQLANNAHHFNERYRTALYQMRANTQSFTDDDHIALHDLLVYSTIEMMRSLHLGERAKGNANFSLSQLQSIDPALFQSMLSNFGAEGARNNRGYSACGLEIFAGGEPERKGSPQSAFGGVDGEESSKKKIMSCPFCSAKVFGDPCAKVLACWDCKARVVNGRLVSESNGGSKAREAQAKAAAEETRKAEQRARKESETALAEQVDDAFKGVNTEALQTGVKASVPTSRQLAQTAFALAA